MLISIPIEKIKSAKGVFASDETRDLVADISYSYDALHIHSIGLSNDCALKDWAQARLKDEVVAVVAANMPAELFLSHPDRFTNNEVALLPPVQKAIPLEAAKKIDAELKKQGFDFEIGYDKVGSLHIECGEVVKYLEPSVFGLKEAVDSLDDSLSQEREIEHLIGEKIEVPENHWAHGLFGEIFDIRRNKDGKTIIGVDIAVKDAIRNEYWLSADEVLLGGLKVWGLNKFGQLVKEHDMLESSDGGEPWITHVMLVDHSDGLGSIWHREKDYDDGKVVGSYTNIEEIVSTTPDGVSSEKAIFHDDEVAENSYGMKR